MFKLSKLIRNFNLEPIYIPSDINVDEYEFEAEATTNGHYEYYDAVDKKMIVLFGNEDYKTFETMEKEGEDVLPRFFEKLAKKQKIIVTSRTFDATQVLEFAKANDMILLRSPYRKVDLLTVINSYISYKIAERERVHGSLVNVYGEGILIVGKSGIGKSELVVELLNRGHSFVADDAVDVFKHNSDFIGTPAEITKDFIEIRGIGIINARKTFGVRHMLKKTKINLVIELVDLNDVKEIERLGVSFKEYKVLDSSIPKIQLPVAAGRNVASLIETAVTEFKQKKYYKYNALDELEENQNKN